MAKRRSKDTLVLARKYSELLLYESTGGTMGKPPSEVPNGNTLTFGEKRGLLDSLIKIATLEQRFQPETEESGFDLIRKGFGHDSTKNGSGRDLGGAESISLNGSGEEPGDREETENG